MVGSEGRVGDEGERQRLLAFVQRRHLRLGEADNQHFSAQLPNRLVMLLHLAEMRPAWNSAEMAQEDQ